MPETRLFISPHEIIGLEVSCATCHHTVRCPLGVPDQPLAPLMALKTLQPCPWCGASAPINMGDALKQLLQALTPFIGDATLPLRIVVQQ